MAEYPDQTLDHDLWRALFSRAGYAEDGRPATRTAAPLTLWRGSVSERRSNWSWTDNREVAARYASGEYYWRPQSSLWVAEVDPARLLARNSEREESEYVVDTDGLDIRPA